MYKTIEISDIFGTLYSIGKGKEELSLEKIDYIFSQVRVVDHFVKIERTTKSIMNMMELVDVDHILYGDCIRIPRNDIISRRLERQFFRLDRDTRILLVNVVNGIF